VRWHVAASGAVPVWCKHGVVCRALVLVSVHVSTLHASCACVRACVCVCVCVRVRASVCVSVRSSPFVVLSAAPGESACQTAHSWSQCMQGHELVAGPTACVVWRGFGVSAGLHCCTWFAALVCSAVLPCLILSVWFNYAVWVLAVASEVPVVVVDVCHTVTVSSTVTFVVLPR
jgi:hypothetical protein